MLYDRIKIIHERSILYVCGGIMEYKRKDKVIDENTKQYIKNVRLLQAVVMIVVIISFFVFAHTVISNNRNNLKEVVLVEVQESMRETINNIIVHIESERFRIEEDAMIDVIDLSNRMKKEGVQGTEDILSYLNFCDENQLGQAIEVIYTTRTGVDYYINRYERKVFKIDGPKESLYKDAAICDIFTIDGQEIIIFVRQKVLDELAKEEIHNYLHAESYEGNQYVWVNEVLDMNGGSRYAVRRIHPNLVESEGEYLSTSMEDVKGNYPYKTELEGIKENGYVFHSYYFKNKVNDEIKEKFSYAQYYEPFNWIIATGESIEEVYAYAEEINTHSFYQIMVLMIVFILLFAMTSGIMIKNLSRQAQNFRKTLLKQAEVYEDIYNVLSVGLLRLCVEKEKTSIIQVNPKALETLGVETEEELASKINGHYIETMLYEDAEKLVVACQNLNEQWESVVTECHVKWKDGSRRLIRIRDTLVDYDNGAKIIQRMCQDITEERYQQEKALLAAEEKATLDPMTQIKNKKAIETIIRAQIMEAAEKDLPIGIGFVDIDNFREYNTKYGHMQGDEVIKYVANTVKEAVPGIVGRNGGDEFAFVMLGTSYAEVENAMKTIHKKLNEGIIIKETGEKIPTPCSIGVVIEKNKNLDYDYVMEQSDAAMYEAKARGKNTYHILDNTEV